MSRDELLDAIKGIYEVWAGADGIPSPMTVRESYLFGLVEDMRDIAGECLTKEYLENKK